MAGKGFMSLESALEEERQQIMALLEGTAPPRLASERMGSPGARSPMRSMLDIAEKPPAVRSMLDVGDTPSPRVSPTAPTFGYAVSNSHSLRVPSHNRSSSDAASSPPDTLRYSNRRRSHIPNNMASVIRAADEDGNPITLPGPRAMTEVSRKQRKSQSPGGRLGRSASPGASLLASRPHLVPNPNTVLSNSGQIVDMSNAWRRLSNAQNMGNLGLAPAKHARNQYGETVSPTGGVRLTKDYHDDGEDALATSDDSYDSDDIDSGNEWDRGRKMTRPSIDGPHDTKTTLGMGSAGPRKQSKSLLGALEDERLQVSQAVPYRVKSLLGPDTARRGVHPATNFADSGISTPMDSDEEADIRDIKRAQRLDLALSPIISTPESHRAIRTITRGDFQKTQQIAEDGNLRERMYLVATDLSDEAMYALEWTVGTVLRDGDTLLAVYAIDEERTKEGLSIGDGMLAVKDHDVVLGSLERKSLAPPTDRSSTPARTKSEQERFRATEDITQRCLQLLRKTKLQVKVVVEVFHCKSPRHLICEVIDFMEPTLVILGSRGRSALKGVLLGSFSNYLVTKSSVPVMVARRRLRKPTKSKTPLSGMGMNGTGMNMRLANNLTGLAQGIPKSRLDNAIIDK